MAVANSLPPHKIKKMLLSDLRKVRLSFFKAESAIAMDQMSTAEKRAAGDTLISTNIAIRKLETIELSEIADDLASFKTELTKASKDLNKAVKKLAKFKTVLDQADVVLKLLSKIANLAGVAL